MNLESMVTCTTVVQKIAVAATSVTSWSHHDIDIAMQEHNIIAMVDGTSVPPGSQTSY